MNECHKARHLLGLRAADRSSNEQAYLEAHLQDCPSCAAWAQQYREQDALISTLPRVRPSLSQEQRFLANIHNERGHIAMFGQLTRIISAAAFVAVLVLLGIITRALLPTSLPDQDRSPASSGESISPVEKEYILYDDDNRSLYAVDVVSGETITLLHDGDYLTGVSCASAVGHIAFTEYVEGDAKIAVMDLHTREITHLPNATASDSSPALSPDGQRIAFISDHLGNELYVMQADGSELTQLTDLQSSGVFYPSWSPDGTQIVFSLDNGDNVYLYIVDADGNNLRQVTESPGIAAGPAWSPDGNSIAFTLVTNEATTIYTIAPDGSNLKRLTVPESVDGTPVSYLWSAWSPDGTRLAYVRGGVEDSELYVMDIATTESVAIPITTSDILWPCWMRGSIELVPAPESVEPIPTPTFPPPPTMMPTTPTPIPTPGAPASLSIAYTHSDGGLWLTNGPGTDRKLTSGEMDVSPVFSADGRKVLFRRYFPSAGAILDKWELCVADIVYGGPETCFIATYTFTTTNPTLRRLPYVEKWLADSRTIAFSTMFEPVGGGMGYNGYKNIGLVDTEYGNYFFVWDTQEAVDDRDIVPSTDANYIAFASNNEIAVVSLAQQDLVLRHTFEKASVPPASIPVVAWAKDNASVLAAVYSPDQTPQSLTMDLWQIELGGNAIQLATGLPPMRYSYGQWAPDRQSFAYTTLGSGDVKPGDLYVVSREDGASTPYNTESVFLGWNPNSEQFAFAMPEGNKFYWLSELYLGQLGSDPVTIVSSYASGNGVLFIDWVDEESFVYKVNLGESGYEIRLGHVDGSYQLMTTVAPGIATDRSIAVYPGNRE